MKRFVNGVEADLQHGVAEIETLSDRLMVRTPNGSDSAVAIRQGETIQISYRGQTYTIEKAARVKGGASAGDGFLRAPMPGLIVDVLVMEGDHVSRGDKVLVLEAMKTQQAFAAPFDGKVARVQVTKGQQVAEGELLAVIEPGEVAS